MCFSPDVGAKKGELPDQKDTEKIYKKIKQVTEWKELHSGDAVTLLRWTCHGVWDSDDVGCCDSVLTILISRTSTTNCRSSAMVSQRQTCSCSCQNPISGNLTPAQRAMGTIALSVASIDVVAQIFFGVLVVARKQKG